jgi:hypothetical protein
MFALCLLGTTLITIAIIPPQSWVAGHGRRMPRFSQPWRRSSSPHTASRCSR